MQIKFKKDKFRENRGNYSRFLDIFCDSCKNHLLLYQKDGAGELKRMYLDRILTPNIPSLKSGNFKCFFCDKIIGTFFLYEKEKRPAIRLYQGSVFKKIKSITCATK